MSNNILVIGAQNIDIFSDAITPYNLHDSNPSKIHMAFGGVGRNIAANLKRLGNNVSFLTVFGDDHFSALAKIALDELQIHISESLHVSNQSNSIYMGIMQNDDLYLGLNDMDIVDRLNIDFFISKEHYINSFEHIVIDNNLSQEVIEYLVQTYKNKNIYMDAVSAHKVHKIKGSIQNITVLKLNHLEATTLTNEQSITQAITNLQAKTDNTILITNQHNQINIIKHNTISTITPNKVTNIINASGAGDAFISGYIHGVVNHFTHDQSLQIAMKSASITLKDQNSTSENLSIEEVLK